MTEDQNYKAEKESSWLINQTISLFYQATKYSVYELKYCFACSDFTLPVFIYCTLHSQWKL